MNPTATVFIDKFPSTIEQASKGITQSMVYVARANLYDLIADTGLDPARAKYTESAHGWEWDPELRLWIFVSRLEYPTS